MATYTVNADQLAYRSSGAWTNGKARQGVYGGTRYEGAIRFAGLSELNFSNIAISQLELRVTFLRAGGSSTKNLTFYKATSNTISGAIRGASIGAISVGDAYGRTVTLTFNAGANSSLFNTIRSYLSEGNRVLCIYVPRTRGTYSGGYCYDYLGISSASITFTYEYLQSDGTMATTSVAAGSAARLNITAYNSAYTHKVVWKFGSYSATQSIAAGATYASYTIPLSWLSAIPNATSGAATATLETIDTTGASLGSYSYGFTITVPASVVPTISSVSAAPVNDNSVISGWGIYVYGKSKAKLSINSAAGAYGSTIKSYSINIRIFCYDPEDEMVVRHFISQIKTDQDLHCNLIERNLYEIFLAACDDMGITDSIAEMEESDGGPFLLEQLHAAIGVDDFVARIDDQPHNPGDVLLLTGIGTVFPFMRIHVLLEALQPHFPDVPILIMYPGTFDGHHVKLFNRLKPNDYYRAFNVL